MTATHSPDWYTPEWLLQLVRDALCDRNALIGLDPCAESDRAVPALKHFTIADDGLALPWKAETVYCNPPYRNMEPWSTKFLRSYIAGEFQRGLLLGIAATDTCWFRDCWDSADGIVFLTGRVKFRAGVGQQTTTNMRGSVLVYCGDRSRSRLDVFRPHGIVIIR